MGGLNSNPYAGEIKTEWMDVFYAMKLTRPEVIKLYEVYIKIDCDKSGSIDVVELLTLMDIERTLFTERIFSAFDKDHTGKIDFYEFVVSLWKFCTLGNGAISVFTFDLYDKDADGIISPAEAIIMFNELTCGTKSNGTELDIARNSLLTLAKNNASDTVLIDDFRPYCRTHQALLFPVFAVQDKLKRGTLGALFWDKLSQRRIELRPGYNVPLAELMVLHADRKLFRNLLEDQTVMSISTVMKTVLENTDNSAHYKVNCRRKSMTMRIKDSLVNTFSFKERSKEHNHEYHQKHFHTGRDRATSGAHRRSKRVSPTDHSSTHSAQSAASGASGASGATGVASQDSHHTKHAAHHHHPHPHHVHAPPHTTNLLHAH